MGDRANVVVKSGDEQVCLYTHWAGTEMPETLRAAMIRGSDRLDDFQYLNRIIFCEMVGDKWKDTSGYGISQSVHDGGNRVITVDVDAMTVQVGTGDLVPFEDYVKSQQGW